MWLKNDARIADIRRQEGAVYYLTNDRVLVLRPMYNAPGYAYDDEDSNKERGKTTKLASNKCHNEVHAEQAAIISEALHSPYKPEIYSDAGAVQ